MKRLNELFDYDSVSFSFFRVSFYLTTLYFFTLKNNIFSDWSHISGQFWEPISFFKYCSRDLFFSVDPQTAYWLFVAGMLLSAAGLFYRISSIISFTVFILVAGLPCNFGKIHHSNHMTAVLLGLLCLVPSGKLSLDYYLRKKRQKISNSELWTWFFFTVIAYMSLVYGSAGFQKLRNTGWMWTDNEAMATIILTRPTVTPLGIWIAQSDWIPGLLAKFALLLELLAPIAIFMKNPYRFFYGFLLFSLHQGMYMTLGDHGAFFPYQICFLAWVPWPWLVSKLKLIRPLSAILHAPEKS